MKNDAPTTLAGLKRYLTVGSKLIMTHNSWYPNGQLIGVPRTIVEATPSRIALRNVDNRVSHLEYPKASHMKFTATGFSVCLKHDGSFTDTMSYRYA